MAFPPLSRDELPRWLVELLWKYNADVANSRLKRFVPNTHESAFLIKYNVLYDYLVILKRLLDDYTKLALPLDVIAKQLQSLNGMVAWSRDERLSPQTHKSIKSFLNGIPGFSLPEKGEELDLAKPHVQVSIAQYKSCYDLFWFAVNAAHDESVRTASD